MRHSQTEKMEIIRIVEQSHLPIKHTLKELAIASSTFYNWYQRFQIYGYVVWLINPADLVGFGTGSLIKKEKE